MGTMARFIQATHAYLPEIGGVSYVVKALAEGLVAKGHDVTIFTGSGSAKQPTETYEENVKVIRWPTRSVGNAYFLPQSRKMFAEKLGGLINQGDVLHIHNIHALFASSAWNAWSKRKNQDCKLVVTPYYHGGGHTVTRGLLWRLWRPRARSILKSADVVHTVSESEARLVKRDFGISCVPIENGVEDALHQLSWRPSNYVIYAGRIEKYKNVHRLARIVKYLNEKHDMHLGLKIVGEGPFETSLRSSLNAMGVEYELRNFQSYNTYLALLSQASLMGLLSEMESYPQSINEANAIGVPVVVAEPWGSNFSGRPRSLSVSMKASDEQIADEISPYLERVGNDPRCKVPTWIEVVDEYLAKVYGPILQSSVQRRVTLD
jgi:1,2-diacylglycerol 3-alpha-glucosyltransferase